MTHAQKRAASLGLVVLFCLLCAGTSRPTGSTGSSPIASTSPATGTAPVATRIPHSAKIQGRIDPLDGKLANHRAAPDVGYFDAFVLNLRGGATYQAVVTPAPIPADAGVPADAGTTADAGGPVDSGGPAAADAGTSSPDRGVAGGIGDLWFSVRVARNAGPPGLRFIAVRERVAGTTTTATFTPAHDGDYTLYVTAYFGQDKAMKPGFSTYELEVTPLSP